MVTNYNAFHEDKHLHLYAAFHCGLFHGQEVCQISNLSLHVPIMIVFAAGVRITFPSHDILFHLSRNLNFASLHLEEVYSLCVQLLDHMDHGTPNEVN